MNIFDGTIWLYSGAAKISIKLFLLFETVVDHIMSMSSPPEVNQCQNAFEGN